MLSVNFFVVLLIVGVRLKISTSINSFIALLLMSLASGSATLGYALLRGIIAPKFFMPEYIQSATLISPMSWRLLVRTRLLKYIFVWLRARGNYTEVIGLILIGLAIAIFKRKN